MRAFEIHEADVEKGCRELRVEGELDLSVVDRLRRRLDNAAMEEVEVLLRLDRCDFIDSSGIAVIVLAQQLMASRGRRLCVCEPSPAVSRVLTVTGLLERGIVYPSTAAALAERSQGEVTSPS